MGDKVVAHDPQTGKATTKTVQQTFITQDTGLLDVTLRVVQAAKSASSTTPALDPAHKQRLVAVASHGSHAPPMVTSSNDASTAPASAPAISTQPGDETIHTTANHPWLSADHGWIVAGQLQLGEPVQRVDGSVAMVVALTSVRGTAPMWDLTVSQVHDFAVGDGAYVVHNCDQTNPYSGRLIKVNKPDAAADRLASRIGGVSRVRFENDPIGREFDAVSERYVAQTKPALTSIKSSFRRQAKATFEAALGSGRRPYFHFEGALAQEILDKLDEYAGRYGIRHFVDVRRLFH